MKTIRADEKPVQRRNFLLGGAGAGLLALGSSPLIKDAQADPGGNKAFWTLQGNQGTSPFKDFLGTIDNVPLVIKTFGVERMRVDGAGSVNVRRSLGIGLAGAPGERVHVGDGNVLVEGGGETSLMFKRDFTPDPAAAPPASGPFANPIFKLGRIIQAGDGDPEIRLLFSDDTTPEHSVFEVDRKGIVASVKRAVGSHFEGFIAGHTQPFFRLNSFPSMRLEMGPGGDVPPDAAVSREEPATLAFHTGADERMRINEAGNVGIGTTTPVERLHVNGTVRAERLVIGNLTITGADYVLAEDYHLMPLDELRGYIAREGHLPNIPSAAEVQRDGVDVAAFQMKLLEKIEELTRYVLEQQARIETLDKRAL